MQAKIIQVIEVTDYVGVEDFGGAGGHMVPRRRWFLADGSPLVPEPLEAVAPAEPKVHVHHHEDGSVSASIFSSH